MTSYTYDIFQHNSQKERKDLVDLVREHRDVFSFTYDEVKAYKYDIFQHTIPLKEEVKHFKKNLRHINNLI